MKKYFLILLLFIALFTVSLVEPPCEARMGAVMMGAGGGPTPAATITGTETRMSIIDGAAFIWLPTNDISAYAGTTGSSTPYRIEIKDSAGKYLKGFLGSQGSGETLDGTNLFTNGDFASGDMTGWTHSTDWTVSSNQAAKGVTGTTYLDQNVGIWKKLYKYTYNVAAAPSCAPRPLIQGNTSGYDYCGATGTLTFYTCHGVDYNNLYGVIQAAAFTGTLMDDFVLKQVTDGPALYSLHIVSTSGGATRNWTSMDSGFAMAQNGNLSYTVYIYAVP